MLSTYFKHPDAVRRLIYSIKLTASYGKSRIYFSQMASFQNALFLHRRNYEKMDWTPTGLGPNPFQISNLF